MLYFLQKFLVKFLRFWVWLAIKLEAWLRPGSLLLEMICWSGCRKITVDSSMLFTELETLIEPSSTMAFNCDIYWALFLKLVVLVELFILLYYQVLHRVFWDEGVEETRLSRGEVLHCCSRVWPWKISFCCGADILWHLTSDKRESF